MGDLDDGDAILLVELLEELHDLAALVGVQVAGGFVGEDDRGFGDQRAGDAHELLLTAGELRGIKVFLRDHVEAIERVAHDALAVLLGRVAIGERDLEIFVNGEVVEQVVALEDETEMFLLQLEAFLFVELVHGFAEQLVFTRPGAVVQAEDVEQGGLAGTGRTHDRHELTCGDFQVDVAQRVERTAFQRINTIDVAKRNHRRKIT
ncbi:MAG: hypothetical protein NVV63_18240 [Opitutus sp.]|nr:hypothetical protein [Opitutus sp.]